MERVFFCLRIAETYMFQAQFQPAVLRGFQRLSFLEGKRFWCLQEFPDQGQGYALAVERGKASQNALDPSGEFSCSGKIEQELGGGEPSLQGHAYKAGIGDTIAQKSQHQVQQAA